MEDGEVIVATQIRAGMIILLDGELYKVLESTHVTPGKGRGMMQTKLRKLSTGSQHDVRFRSSDNVEKAMLERREMEFLYSDDTGYHFMDHKTYDQLAISAEDLGDMVLYLLPNTMCMVEVHEGRPLGVEPPLTVELKVVDTEPVLKGATATNKNKPAKMETGLVVQVPPFISIGEVLRIDTRTGNYIERAK
jgi:elongation factor P